MTHGHVLKTILVLTLLLLFLFLAYAGCGSASGESYLREVGDLYRKATENMREAADALEEAGEDGGDARRAAAESLQEASEAWMETGHGLSRIRVPAGWEEFHSRLLELCASGEELCRRLAETISEEKGYASGEDGTSPAEGEGEAEMPAEGEHLEKEAPRATDEAESGEGH